MRFILLGLCSTYVFFLSGCASSWQYVKTPERQLQVAGASRARIYVIRADAGSKMASARISDNGIPIGNTGPRGYLCWEREPGAVKLTSLSAGEAATELTVAAGGIYYVRQTVDPGFVYGKTSLTIVSEKEGLALLKSCGPAYVTRAEAAWKGLQNRIESVNPTVVYGSLTVVTGGGVVSTGGGGVVSTGGSSGVVWIFGRSGMAR